MFACTDVGYDENTAQVACVTFDRWDASIASQELVEQVPDVQPYVPGQFYQRELPGLLSILEKLPTRPEVVVIDGYVWLDENGRKGLGAHLFASLSEAIPIIGVAKTHFATATNAIQVLRGSSVRPLYVTAAGMDQAAAADCIRRMHGENRIPTLLKRADQLSRVRT
jgi:deoxyribonuclease V